jgi:hypothetical protein
VALEVRGEDPVYQVSQQRCSHIGARSPIYVNIALIVSEICGKLAASLFDIGLLIWYRVRRLFLLGGRSRERINPRDLLVTDFLVGVGASDTISVGGKGGPGYEKYPNALPLYAARCHMFA